MAEPKFIELNVECTVDLEDVFGTPQKVDSDAEIILEEPKKEEENK